MGATTVAGSATLKVAGKAAKPVIKAGVAKLSGELSKLKTAWMARFGENLSAGYSSKKVAMASTSEASTSKNFTSLDWSSYRISHVREHMNPNVSKLEHGVFYGNPIEVTNEAWAIAQEQNIRPILIWWQRSLHYSQS